MIFNYYIIILDITTFFFLYFYNRRNKVSYISIFISFIIISNFNNLSNNIISPYNSLNFILYICLLSNNINLIYSKYF